MIPEFNNSNHIFIIGLPRSGSTLIESILTSSVEKINTCGESHVVNMAVLDQIGPKIYKKNFNINSFKFEINLDIISKAVLDRYFQFNKKNNYKFVDKSLENFFNVEIIKEIFPKAKFLHTYRRPLDSIISIYQSMLSDLSWTHTFEDIFSYVDNYLKVLNYLKDRDCNIMHINLEKFTDNSEEMSKKIFDFCNLTWSKDILQFYERKDLFAKTLSFNQANKPIYKSSIKKHELYEKELTKLKEKEILFPCNNHYRGLNDMFFITKYKTFLHFENMLKNFDKFLEQKRMYKTQNQLYWHQKSHDQ